MFCTYRVIFEKILEKQYIQFTFRRLLIHLRYHLMLLDKYPLKSKNKFTLSNLCISNYLNNWDTNLGCRIYIPWLLVWNSFDPYDIGSCKTFGWQEWEISAVIGKSALPFPPRIVSIAKELTRKTPYACRNFCLSNLSIRSNKKFRQCKLVALTINHGYYNKFIVPFWKS